MHPDHVRGRGWHTEQSRQQGRTLAPTSLLCPASIECSPVLRRDKVGAPKSLQKNKHSTCGSNVHKCAVRACSLRACPLPPFYTQPDGSSLISSPKWTDQPAQSKPSHYHSQKAVSMLRPQGPHTCCSLTGCHHCLHVSAQISTWQQGLPHHPP